MKAPIYQVDAFTSRLFRGNPAAVVLLDDWLPDDVLQAIAAENNLTETVPALLTAGGKALESFTPHWQCHTWDNCPMAHAFSGIDISAVPILLRPRAEQFIQFFDAKQIPWPLPTREELDADETRAQTAG